MEGKLFYTETGWNATSATSDLATAKINLARDLSQVNRKNMHMTTAKGVPLVYHCRLTAYRNFATDAANSVMTTQVATAQSNYVTRNAAVKLHAAREAMFRNAGIKKSDRGRYDRTIRYGWDAAGDSYAFPNLSDDGGSTFYSSVGEWDESKIAIDEDTSLYPVLFGPQANENGAISADTFNLTNAYLNSRRKLDEDDLDAGDGAADHSIIRSMFNVEDATDDELQVIADDNQDEPPYDQDAAAGAFTSQSLSEIAFTGDWSKPSAVLEFDAPFGLAEIFMAKMTDSAKNLSGDTTYSIEVLGISEMQG